MNKLLVLIAFTITLNSHAQIINTESLRMVTDTIGWSGSAGLHVSFIKNTKEIFRIKTKTHVQYKHVKHLLLLMNDISFERADGSDFVNKGVQHLRYNYRFHKRLAWELFLQNQYNAISKIDYRRLAGTGFRYKCSQSDKFKVYLGSLIMYENEKTLEIPAARHQDWRNSTYLSFSLYLNENISIISTTYYQPILKKFSDYRVSHQSAFNFKIYKNLSFKTSFNFTYDASPVLGIPNREYELTNGFTYSFK